MTSETTSLAPTNSAPEQWRQFAAFVKRPQLPHAVRGFTLAALASVLRLLLLDLMLMAVLLLIVVAVEKAGFVLPDNVLSSLDLNIGMVLLIVIGAPLMEEALFRSWLSGKSSQILALIALVVLSMGGPFLAGFYGMGDEAKESIALLGVAGILLGIAAAGFILWYFRGRAPMGWFARHFRWFYYASALAFASIHLTNYTEGNALLLLPLTVPQFILGLLAGYTRVVNGFWSAVLLHASHNGIAIGIVMAAAQAA